MPEHDQTRTPESVQPDRFGVIGIVGITVIWILALLVFLVLHLVTEVDYGSQLLVCGAGVITGVLTTWFFIARKRRLLRNAQGQARQS